MMRAFKKLNFHFQKFETTGYFCLIIIIASQIRLVWYNFPIDSRINYHRTFHSVLGDVINVIRTYLVVLMVRQGFQSFLISNILVHPSWPNILDQGWGLMGSFLPVKTLSLKNVDSIMS